MSEPSRPGRIITFYSYKGGTGRSMALANVAWILASNGKRVLAVDWDLEAPGLHRYFAPFLVDSDLASSEGVMDLVIEFATEALTAAPEAERPKKDWYLEHTDILGYAASLEFSFPNKGTLDFICAGRQGPTYSTRVNTFDWRSFYERLGGGVFLEAVKERMRAEYDYVLIDSRTGASDTSGVCTVQMPDDLVVCFTLNNQSIDGAATVTASAQEQRRDQNLRIFPVPMRVELAEKDKLEARRDHCRRRLALYPVHLSGTERGTYWDAVEVLYVPYYAYEEILAAFGDRPGAATSLLGSLERLTSYLTGGTVRQSAPVPEALRQDVLRRYAQRPAAPDDLDLLAETSFTRLRQEVQSRARKLLPRFVRLARPNETTPDTAIGLPVEELPVVDLRSLAEAGLVKVEIDPSGREHASLAHEGFVTQWKRFSAWLAEDRDFLLWRQQLHVYLTDWESTGREGSALLSGAQLETAMGWLKRRSEDVSASEKSFIQASDAARSLARSRRGRRQGLAVLVTLAAVGFALSSVWVLRQQVATVQSTSLRSEAALSESQGDTAAASGDLEVALRQYSTAIDGFSSYEKSLGSSDPGALAAARKTQASVLLKRGRIRDRNGDFTQAVADYGQAIALMPEGPDTYLARGLSLSKAGDAQAAMNDFNHVLSLTKDPTLSATAQFNIGTVLERTGRPDEAIAAYTQAIQLRENYTDAYFSRALVYEASRQKERAVADFEAVVRFGGDPKSVEAARARLAALVPPTSSRLPPVRPPTAPLVYVVYADKADYEIARRLGQALESKRLAASRVVAATDASSEKADAIAKPSRAFSSEVRYFRREDEKRAFEASGLAESALASFGYRASLQPVLRSARGFGEASLEVWLPPLSRRQQRAK